MSMTPPLLVILVIVLLCVLSMLPTDENMTTDCNSRSTAPPASCGGTFVFSKPQYGGTAYCIPPGGTSVPFVPQSMLLDGSHYVKMVTTAADGQSMTAESSPAGRALYMPQWPQPAVKTTHVEVSDMSSTSTLGNPECTGAFAFPSADFGGNPVCVSPGDPAVGPTAPPYPIQSMLTNGYRAIDITGTLTSGQTFETTLPPDDGAHYVRSWPGAVANVQSISVL